MEHHERVAGVEAVVVPAALGEDAELLALLFGAESLPVDGELHVAVFGPVVGQQALQAVVVELHLLVEKGLRIAAQHLRAGKNAGVHLKLRRLELVVDDGLHVAQEVGRVAEVVRQVHARDQPVSVVPRHADLRREADAEDGFRLAEPVARIFAVVEFGLEVGARDPGLRPQFGQRGQCRDEEEKGCFFHDEE